MALEDHYKPEPEYLAHFWKELEESVKHLSNDELYRGSFLFSDEIRKRSDKEYLERDLKDYLTRSKTVEEFINFAKCAPSDKVRAVTEEELRQRFEEKEELIKGAF